MKRQRPNGQRSFITQNIQLWKTTFWEAWEPLPFDQKLTWIAFVTQTIAVVSLIELLLLDKP